MTKREKFEAMINYFNGVETEPEKTMDIAEMVEFCNSQIVAIEKKAAQAKAYADKKRTEDDRLKLAIADTLDSIPKTASDVLKLIEAEFPGVTRSKVSVRLVQLVKDEVAVASDVKTKEALPDNKSITRTHKGYTLAE